MYMTFFKRHQFSIDDFLNDIPQNINDEIFTVKRNNFWSFFMKHEEDKWHMMPPLPNFPVEDIPQHYKTFYIPKKSGGMREINAPDVVLSRFLREMADYLQNTLHILSHNAAHAYVRNRSTITAIQEHQRANHQYFLKLDMHDFFGSHNLDYVMDMLSQVYPIGEMMRSALYEENLRKRLEYAFLNGKLPQGTPLSPALTNICMVPIDYQLQKEMFNGEFTYTRYADDLLISSTKKWNWKLTVDKINDILKENNAPFHLNKNKTRFGSRSGANWNLGVMLNKDNRITIGHKRNQQFRAMLNNLLQDYKRGVVWNVEDRWRLLGLISYYTAVDKTYTEDVIDRYNKKFSLDIKKILRENIKEEIPSEYKSLAAEMEEANIPF